ncbi:Phospholipid phosphatase 6 [Araneus ventricosus]|uniref:Phospholipid phosphatase 6 n=1 Tax=Araneus ventricosus TaxID=182803 RepID=A0A4Y2BDA2_ARAVE|nr:Phospholipid phosphatase 6 [Araneus ventricosus]
MTSTVHSTGIYNQIVIATFRHREVTKSPLFLCAFRYNPRCTFRFRNEKFLFALLPSFPCVERHKIDNIKAENMSKVENDFLRNLLELDKNISLSLSLSASKTSPLGHLRPHMKALEYSCHGLFWISGCIIGLWFSNTIEREAFFFNILLAFFLDIVCVAFLKATLRRKRPSNNEEDMFLTVSIDKMSSPSGHTSRAVLLTYLFIASTPEWYLFHLVLMVWCVCTCASRVLLGRHHVGDVLLGAVLGYIEYLIIDYIWAGPETAEWYLSIFRESPGILDDL